MPEFISKLQYKTYEKGEYSDEKARSLEETLELIKNFPWAREQYADVSVTGPSITIQDESNNFLKAGIYFGGRYSLYYMDSKHQFYELMNVKIDVVYEKINKFFKGQIDLHRFEKERFSFGTKGYFVTNRFEYRVKFWKVIFFSNSLYIYFIPLLVFLFIIVLKNPFSISELMITTPILILGGFVAYTFSKFYKKRNQYLKISRGNREFLFGDNQNEIKIYSKDDITKIIHYVGKGSRSNNFIEIYEVIFKDNSSIALNNMIISRSTLHSKFSDKWNISTEYIGKYNLAMLRMI